MDAEKGKASTGIVVYAALLWLYDMLNQLEEVANPANDKERPILQENGRVRKGRRLDNDF